jgi:hypothetical protein
MKEYSPHATAYAVRCEPHSLRTWRTQGHLAGLSERKGKGHLFSLSDVARIAVAAFIARCGASLTEAFKIVRERGSMIDSVVGAERTSAGQSDYFLTFVIDPDTSFPASITGAPAPAIAFDTEPTGVLQLNVSKLIRSALERLDTFDKWDEDAPGEPT